MRAPSVAFYIALLVAGHLLHIKLLSVVAVILAVLCSVAWRYALRNVSALQLPPAVASTAAFITGTSSGIGRALALELAAQGVLVYAAVRKQQDGDAVAKQAKNDRCAGEIIPVICDVTVRQSLLDAAAFVRKDIEKRGVRGLGYLFPNAGVMSFQPVEIMDDRTTRQTFDVNFHGVVNTLQAFIPLVRDYASQNAGARIGLISSVGGLLSYTLAAPYCPSKFAVEALGDALRGELRPFKIAVTLYEFGAIESALNDANEKVEYDLSSRYGKLQASYKKFLLEYRKDCISAAKAALEVRRNSFSKFPASRVLFGSLPDMITMAVMQYVPDTVRDYAFSFLLKW